MTMIIGFLQFIPQVTLAKFLPHQVRVIGELTALAENIQKLQIFRGSKPFEELHLDERALLDKQLEDMHRYATTLRMRIELFALQHGVPKCCPMCGSEDLERDQSNNIRMNHRLASTWDCLSCQATFHI